MTEHRSPALLLSHCSKTYRWRAARNRWADTTTRGTLRTLVSVTAQNNVHLAAFLFPGAANNLRYLEISVRQLVLPRSHFLCLCIIGRKGKLISLFCTACISGSGKIQSHAFYTMGRSQLFRQMQLLQKGKGNCERASQNQHAHSRDPFRQEKWTFKSWAPPEYPIPGTNPSVTSEVEAPPLCTLQFSWPQQSGSNPGNKAELHRKEQGETLG